MRQKLKASTKSLTELKEGAVEELYQEALSHVLGNIEDPNTKATAPRKVTVTMTLTPSPDRAHAAVDVVVATKLAGPEPVCTSFTLKTEQGVVIAHEPTQDKLFADPSAN